MSDQRVSRPRRPGDEAGDGAGQTPRKRPQYLEPDYRSPGERIHRRPSKEVFRRRRLVVAVLAGILALVLVLLLGFVWPGFWRSDEEPEPLPTVTVTAPAPTPTVDAMARAPEETAFQKALPSAVLQFALVSQAESPATLDAGAVEAWTFEYGDGSRTVTVVAGQWATPEEATAATQAMMAAAGQPTAQGDVLVGDQVVGTYVITPGSAADLAVATWHNGTAVFQATGPLDVIEEFYAAFPL
ncbi:hypothetical protein L1785_00430 [Antribacter sp. KLBMP9083]|uniref:Uncharacterized protein n=1 Tax=Antribacter soli TaxID=2910976 RepID=A0AA41U7K6_9MICO|nr:hypothetical protein [Antribacter soli]MCF4119447.1 hypothetical protein [Antribacter soli]